MTYYQSKQSLLDVAQTRAAREVELKLTVPEAAQDAVVEQLEACMASPQAWRRHEVTTYFDTDDEALAKIGVSLRVRFSEGRFTQTLKANRKDAVAADRAEWEWPVDGNSPNLMRAAEAPLTEKLPEGLDLKPFVTTEINRTIRVLDLGNGTQVEAALDEGVIQAGDLRQPVRELELELRRGDPGPMFRWALELHRHSPLTIQSESKAERGYRLRSNAKLVVHTAKDVTIQANLSAVQAFQQIVTATLGHLLANQPVALSGDAEGLHQMRVAIRRVRAALTLFQPHLDPQAASQFQAELRCVGRIFGLARDWDVFSLQMFSGARNATVAADWCELLQPLAKAERQTAHRQFELAVLAPEFTELVLALAAWVENATCQRGLLGDAELERPIADLAPALLDRLVRKVRKRGRHMASQSDVERHKLRKSLKKLRYGIDYVRDACQNQSAGHYLQVCKYLQKTLGDANDAVTAMTLLGHLGESDPQLAPAIREIRGQLRRRRRHSLRKLTKRWKKFRAQQAFWR